MNSTSKTCASASAEQYPPANQSPILWYLQPATEWTGALPIGNGRLGAMVFGGTVQERLQLNEDTLWAGGPYDPVNPEAKAALPAVRELVFAGKYRGAADLVSDKVMATPLRQMPYETAGDLLLDFEDASSVTEYRRELDLDTAIARVAYADAAGVKSVRESFVSPVDQVLVVRLSADRPGRVSFHATFQTPQIATVVAEGRDTLVLHGTNGTAHGIAGKLSFEARVHALADGGNVSIAGDKLTVTGANSALLLVAIATSYKRFDDVSGDPAAATRATLAAAAARSYDAIRADHVTAHQNLFRRVSIDLGRTTAVSQPTDQRIRDLTNQDDPALAALYFQYGRYLLICSSRSGTQAANLQGIWNESLTPPWGSKYTININTQMNYWTAEPTNLAECVEPLIEMIEDLAVTGARTAKSMYGAGGWVCHHNTDLWRATAPIDGPNWGMWPTGGAWLCKHLFDHFDFGGNRQFLARAYPLMRGAAQFFLDTLVEDPKHQWLVTCPSLSPENMHPHGSAVCAGPTMDMQILRDLFNHCITSANVLGIDGDFVKTLRAMRDRLVPSRIGHAGQLQEWMEDWDTDAHEQHHRHVSHLYGLYPSDQIDPRTTPALADACETTLNTRGDLTTGWAIAWRINLWARLLDGERTHRMLKLLLGSQRTYPNMFDAHPPFQIDGNFGGASGIAEMLLQSQNGEVHCLPALPKAWPTGKVTGLRARGGFEVDLAWADGKLKEAILRSTWGTIGRVRYREKSIPIDIAAGKQIKLDGNLT